jgi:hypothetical protein
MVFPTILFYGLDHEEFGRFGALHNDLPVFFFQGTLEIAHVTWNGDTIFLKRNGLNEIVPKEHHEVHRDWI